MSSPDCLVAAVVRWGMPGDSPPYVGVLHPVPWHGGQFSWRCSHYHGTFLTALACAQEALALVTVGAAPR